MESVPAETEAYAVADTPQIGPPAVETGDEPLTRRVVSPGGWRRALVAFVLGAAAGGLVALVTPREGWQRRTVVPGDRPEPFERKA